MRFQMDLHPAGSPAEARWVETPDTIRLADELKARLVDVGLTVTIGRDEAEGGEWYREVYVEEASLALCILDGGGFASADHWGDDLQRAHQAAILTLAAVRDVCGWEPSQDDLEYLREEAAHYSVDPAGSVKRVAVLDNEELNKMAFDLLRNEDLSELDRSRLGLSSSALDVVQRRIAEVLTAEEGSSQRLISWSPGSLGISGGGIDDVDDALEDLFFDGIGDDVTKVYSDLSDERTGKVQYLLVENDGAGDVTVAPLYDHLEMDSHGIRYGWEHAVMQMALRDREWWPAWLPQAIDLLELAGREVPTRT